MACLRKIWVLPWWNVKIPRKWSLVGLMFSTGSENGLVPEGDKPTSTPILAYNGMIYWDNYSYYHNPLSKTPWKSSPFGLTFSTGLDNGLVPDGVNLSSTPILAYSWMICWNKYNQYRDQLSKHLESSHLVAWRSVLAWPRKAASHYPQQLWLINEWYMETNYMVLPWPIIDIPWK